MIKNFKNKIIILFDGNYTEVTVCNNYINAIVMIFLAVIIMILGCVTTNNPAASTLKKV